MSAVSQSTMPESLQDRYSLVREKIASAAARSGRRADEIILVAVTKFADHEQIRAMIDMGHRDFGENKVQVLVQHAAMVEEYLARLKLLKTTKRSHPRTGGELLSAVRTERSAGVHQAPAEPPETVRWHMIGHLQRNKARKAMEFCRLVHSVDSLRLAEELQQIALRRDEVIDVLVQVNCSGEKSKFGCPVPACLPLAEQIDTMVNVRVRGLMTMAPLTADAEESRATFARCRELFEDLRKSGISQGNVNLLSMGMSTDYEIAIQEGANIVRVGSAIFGEPKVSEDDSPETDED